MIKDRIKTAFIQFAPLLGNPGLTLNKIQSLLSTLPDVDLIVLPELANSGYNFTSAEQAFELSESVLQSDFVDFLTGFAKTRDIVIVTGFNEQEDAKLYNSSLLITPGGIRGKYRKIHLFMNEKSIFEPGNLGLPVIDVGFCKLGMQICFDYIFPETWRILGLKGADIICHPSNLVTPYAHKVLPAQALMNRYYIVTANRIGTEGDITFSGRSIISDPEGDIILEAPGDSESVLFADLSLEKARNKNLTALNHVYHDRFPEQYKDLGC
ncbi:MAG: nitrilase-related carbon-nitrogen hydrolase [Bacteroidota bacterium]|nr:nitrilase-related carbon-nitrogen hydrolase [Bacteroidota bacterium]